MFTCPDCQVDNRADAKFCRKCGRTRAELEVAAVISSAEPFAHGAMVATTGKAEQEGRSEPLPEALSEPRPAVLPAAPQTSDIADSSRPQCPSCWTTLRSTDRFCCSCGAPQPHRFMPFLRVCLSCSSLLPEKANYCYHCGIQVPGTSKHRVRAPIELFRDEDSEFFPRFDA